MKFTFERLIIVALLIFVCYFSTDSCRKKQVENSDLEEVVKSKTDTVTFWKDKAGREHGSKIMAEADLSVIKAGYRAEIDSLRDILGIKENQIATLTSVATKTEGTIKPSIDTIATDSSRDYHFDYTDKWISLKGNIGRESFINYQIVDSLSITAYYKKKNLFSRSQLFIDAVSHNPNVKITGLAGFKVNVKQPGRLGIGPYVGYGWNGQAWQPSAGISLQYALIRFR